jgi:hypothetical protein
MRRALEIDTKSFGEEHPNVAIRLNNLATLLQATDRMIEAEPLARRASLIFVGSSGIEHPRTQVVLGNYFNILIEMGKNEDYAWAELRAVLREAGINESAVGSQQSAD